MIRHTWVVEDRKCPDLIDVEWVELHVNDPNLAIFFDSMIGFAPAGVKWRISDPWLIRGWSIDWSMNDG